MDKKVFLVIPSLNPDEKLAKTIAGMIDVGFNDIIVVDDGSDEQHKQFFPANNNNITMLVHEVNRGKGAALKTAFSYIKDNYPDAFGVVTADGDGQHSPEDVMRCADAIGDKKEIILGCRDFSGPDIPRRSRFGNKTTTTVFKLLCGKGISDTQTGLRGFPMCLLDYMCTIGGDRFEYETNMLLKCIGDGVGIKEIKIQTVYIDDNSSSHFRPVRDSIRIYRFFVNYVISSLVSFLADISVFHVLQRVLLAYEILPKTPALAVATVTARVISATVNFTINKTKVFDNRGNLGKTLLKYAILAIAQAGVSYGLLLLITNLLGAQSFWITVIKMCVDTLIFFISFRIQKLWVFKGEVK